MKYYFPVSLSTYTTDFDTGLVFPRHGALQFAFYRCFLFSCSFSTACILHTCTIQLRPWFAVEIMINVFKICQVASTKKMVQEENQSLWFSLLNVLFYLCFHSFTPYIQLLTSTRLSVQSLQILLSTDFIIYRLFHTCITLIIMSQTQLFCCLYTKKAKFYHTLSDLL